ncbi:MAG: molybdopterin cofactor-binding domain-containing protein [Steroidobacteraceae bacterium]
MTSSDRGAWLLSRRQVLLAGGALVVSLAAKAAAVDSDSYTGAPQRPPLVPTELDSWLAVLPDSSVVAYFGKVDVGQAIQVAIAQIVAEELDVACSQVRVVMGDTAKTINQGGASGSTGLELGGLAMRNAAARARSALLTLAARRLRSSLETLQVTDGVVAVRGDERRAVRYGELIGGRYFHIHLHWNGELGNHLRVTSSAPLKRHTDYRVVGKSIRRADLPDKLFGREIYVTDVKIPGMMHGRMIRPPLAGAVPAKVDETSIRHLRDVQIVWHEGLLGVVAAKEWTAVKAARDLRVEWSSPPEPFPPQSALYERIEVAAQAASGGSEPVGDVEQALRGATTIVAATYYWPFQSHASMGPACALADVRTDHATIWTADQKPHYVRDGVAALLGLPREKVHGIWLRGPGSYGRNDGGDAALDAAYLSRAVGKPVRVQGSRAEGTAWDPKAPASVHHVRAGLDAAGRVVAFSYRSKAFSRENIASHPDDPTQSLTGQLTGLPIKTKYVFDVPQEKYRFPSRALSWEVVPALLARASPLRTSHLRDPLGPQLNFASESFIDELAFATHTDPVAFRLQYLADERGIAVIEAAAKRAGWTARKPSAAPRAGELLTGRGIAYARRRNTHVAAIVEVEVSRRTGRVWARRWTVAHDCGLIVNPDNLRLVIEGNILHATSRALLEEVRFDRGRVRSVDWLTYPILETRDAPEEIDIVLIDHKNELPMGAGEPATRPVAAAIANAVFDATGARLRQAPLSAQRVKAALLQRT